MVYDCPASSLRMAEKENDLSCSQGTLPLFWLDQLIVKVILEKHKIQKIY